MDRRKKILFIIQNMEGGGSEKVLSILLNNLDAKKYILALGVITSKGVYYDTLPHYVNKYYLKASRVRYSLHKIFGLITRTKPDLVVTFNVNHVNLYVSLISWFVPFPNKYIVRESTIPSMLISTYGNKRKILSFFYRITYKRVQSIICQSNFMKMDLLNNFDVIDSKTKIINNPIDVEKIELLSREENNTSYYSNCFNLLAVGRLVQVKGFDLLIEAMSLVSSKRVYLTILGGESPEDIGCKDKLIKLVQKYGLDDKIRFVDFTNNPYVYMKNANALVITSRYEGFPNVAIEANSLGIPVIAFNSPGGISDLVIEGVNGWLVENGNVLELAKLIDKSIDFEIDKTRIHNTALKYKVDKVVEQFENCFDSVMK